MTHQCEYCGSGRKVRTVIDDDGYLHQACQACTFFCPMCQQYTPLNEKRTVRHHDDNEPAAYCKGCVALEFARCSECGMYDWQTYDGEINHFTTWPMKFTCIHCAQGA
jgi:hypothetical protein